MAGLDLPSIEVEITADATGALEAIQSLMDALATLQTASDSVEQIISSTKTEETGRNLIAGLVNGLQDLGAVSAAAQAIGAAVVAALQESFANNNLSSALGASVRAAVENASAVASAGGQSVGSALIGGAASGVSSGNNLSSAVGSAIRTAASNAGSTASGAGRSIGSNLMAGVRSGIQSAVSGVIAAARSAVQQAVSAAKAAANISSPSGVMRDEVGVMLMRGVEVGMSERTPTTLQMIRDSMRGLISGATAVVNSNGIPAPAVAIPAPGGPSIDYERLADANASRPVILNVGAKRMAQATRDEAARQQAIRVAQINAGYGGR